MQIKSKQKCKPVKKPNDRKFLGDFCVEECYCELEEMNESLDRIIELEEKLKAERKRPSFAKGVIMGGLIVIIIWTLSLI